MGKSHIHAAGMQFNSQIWGKKRIICNYQLPQLFVCFQIPFEVLQNNPPVQANKGFKALPSDSGDQPSAHRFAACSVLSAFYLY